MEKRDYMVSMSKEDMIHYYANKIVNDGIRECTEFNTIIYLEDYCETVDLKKYKDELLKELYKNEKLADVTIDDDFTIDMVFYTDYCPFYYDEVEHFSLAQEKLFLSEFKDYCFNRVNQEGDLNLRNLINAFNNTFKFEVKEDSEQLPNLIKKNLINIGFVEKNVQLDNEVYINLNNYKDFEKLVDKRLNEFTQEAEQEDEEEM